MNNGNEILNDIMVIFQQQNEIIVIATNIEIVKHVICLEHTHTHSSHVIKPQSVSMQTLWNYDSYSSQDLKRSVLFMYMCVLLYIRCMGRF